MERAWLGVLAGVVACALGCAPASAADTSLRATPAVEPGVTVDEGSPAAKEYALALTQARRTGSSSSTAHSPSSEAPFGAGITPPSSGGAGGSPAGGAPALGHTRTRSRGSAQNPAKTTTGTEASHAPSLPSAVLQAARTGGSGGDGSLLVLLGGGVAILVIGALGGVVLRHNRRPPSHA